MSEAKKQGKDNKITALFGAKKKSYMLALFAVLLVAVIAGTFAWFFESTESDIVAIKGSVEYADFYFDGGDGSQEDPYQINDAQQLSNFAWLQYLGVFNDTDGEGNIRQVYFKVTADINMAGQALPPIGTSDNPFVGNFDGDGHTISNAVVSNRINEQGIQEDTVPSLVDITSFNNDDAVEIIGLFGVVGQKASDSYNYDTQVNEIKNLNIRDSLIKTQTGQTLVGMAAGYVNGKLTGVTVNDCDINIVNNNTAALGQSNGYTDKLSDYGTVGYCTPAYKDTTDMEKVDISKPKLELSTITDTEQGDAWGGSINMVDMHQRLSNVVSASSTTTMTYYQSQTINIDETDGSIEVNNGPTATINPQTAYYDVMRNGTQLSGGNMNSYPSNKVADGDGGNYALHPTSGGQYIGVLGRPTNLDGNGTLTINRYLDEFKDANYIHDGNRYLNLTAAGQVNNNNTAEGTKWVVDNIPDTLGVPGAFKHIIYTIVDGKHYYLSESNGNLTVAETADDRWKLEDGAFCITKGANTLYLNFYNNQWSLLEDRVYYITDNDGDYIRNNAGVISNTDDINQATKWRYDNHGLYIIDEVGETAYYLQINVTNGNVSTTTTGKPHLIYEEGVGIYTLDASSVEVGSWETVGTVEGSQFAQVESYVLDSDGIDNNSTYAIVSMEAGAPRVLSAYRRNANQQYTSYQDNATLSYPIIDEDTKLILNTTGNRTEALQTWRANTSGSGFTLYNTTARYYLNLKNTVTSNPQLTANASDGGILNITGGAEKKVSYTTSGRYVAQEITEVPSDIESGNYYYLYNGNYVSIRGLQKQDFFGTLWLVVLNNNQRDTVFEDSITVYTYEDVESSNYLAHGTSGNFYTSATDQNNTIYFFKKVNRQEATAGIPELQYLIRLINYANGVTNQGFGEDVWNNFQDALAEAIRVRDATSTTTISFDDAKRQQAAVNTAAADLQQAILFLQADRYYLKTDDNRNWVGVAEANLNPEYDYLGALLRSKTEKELLGEEDRIQEVEQTVRGAGLPTYFPINGRNTAEFNANSANTGYVCGANTKSTYQSDSGDIRVSWFPMSSLNTSLNGTANYSNNSNLQVLTRTAASGGLVRVDDEYNNVANCSANLATYAANTVENLDLKKYTDARRNLQSALLANPSRVYGLHFMDALISKDVTFIASKATINGVEYTNYEMPEACIDFKLKEKGYINFFAGSYYTNSGKENNSFFALYEIDRKENMISDIKEIFKIYGDPDDPSKPYKYTYTDTAVITDSGYELMFDTEWIKNPGITSRNYNSMFYYEIPTNAGEYALGSVENKFGAYLVYLDISANKQEVHRQKLSELTQVTTSTYEYPKGIQLTGNAYSNDMDSVSVSISPSASNGTMNLNRTNVNGAVVNTGTLGANVTAKYVGMTIDLTNQGGVAMTASGTEQKSVKTYKETLFDYNTTKAQWKKTEDVVTEAIEGGNTQRTYNQYINGVENAEATGNGPAIQDLSPVAITYHYGLPDGATVQNVSSPTILSADGMYLTGIASGEYPALGAAAVDASGKITAYNVTITPTEAIIMKMDQVLNLFRANVNGQIDMRPGEYKSIN